MWRFLSLRTIHAMLQVGLESLDVPRKDSGSWRMEVLLCLMFDRVFLLNIRGLRRKSNSDSSDTKATANLQSNKLHD